jgi:hypothetical protein
MNRYLDSTSVQVLVDLYKQCIIDDSESMRISARAVYKDDSAYATANLLLVLSQSSRNSLAAKNRHFHTSANHACTSCRFDCSFHTFCAVYLTHGGVKCRGLGKAVHRSDLASATIGRNSEEIVTA